MIPSWFGQNTAVCGQGDDRRGETRWTRRYIFRIWMPAKSS